MMKRTMAIMCLGILALLASTVQAQDVSERLAARMAKLFPKEKVTDISPAPSPITAISSRLCWR